MANVACWSSTIWKRQQYLAHLRPETNWNNLLSASLGQLQLLILPVLTAAADTVLLIGRYWGELLETLQVVGPGARLYLKEVSEDSVELFKMVYQTHMRQQWNALVQVAVNPADTTHHLLTQLSYMPLRYEYIRLNLGE